MNNSSQGAINISKDVPFLETRVSGDDAIYHIIFESVIFIPTIFGNTLLLTALVKFKYLRITNSYIMIGNLAIADLLMGVVCLPVDILIQLVAGVSENRTYCLLNICMIYTTVLGSVMNLCLLSVERFHAIVFPFQHMTRFTKRHIYLMIVISWVVVFLLGFLPIFGWNGETSVAVFKCKWSALLPATYQQLFHAIVLAASLTSCVCFFVITRIALKKSKATINNDIVTPANTMRSTLKRDRRHTHIMLFISGIFVICWAPYCILSLVPRPSKQLLDVRNKCMVIGILNSCMNWMVYGVKNSKFRRAFRTLLCRFRSRKAYITCNTGERLVCSTVMPNYSTQTL